MGFWENRVVPALVSCACSTRPIMKQRQKIIPRARGRVLEIGVGAGTNFRFYDAGQVDEVVAIEPSSGMLRRARGEAARTGLAGRVSLHACGAEALPVDAASIDTAVVTFVLCTIPDWQSALREVRRVLKPGGMLLFSEHGLSPDAAVARWQRRIEPIWKRLAGGCHLTRDTLALLRATGFSAEQADTMYLPGTPRIAGWVTWGTARPA